MKRLFSEGEFITDENGNALFCLLSSADYNGRYFTARAQNMVCGQISFLKFVYTTDDKYKINNLTREGNFRFCYPFIEHVYGNFHGFDADGNPIFGTEVEYIEGVCLTEFRQRIEEDVKRGIISRKESERWIFRQILQFLCGMNYYTSYAKKVYLQRDLKPDNILITPDNQVKIVDFDVAHISGSTKTMHVTGWEAGFSKGYTSPEVYSLVCRRKEQDIHCEIYSAGRVLFYWLNGVGYYTDVQCEPLNDDGSLDNLFSASYCRNQELAYGINANKDRFLKHYYQEEYTPLLKILDKMCAAPDEERYEKVGDVIYDMKQFLLTFCESCLESVSDFLRLSESNLLLDRAGCCKRNYIPLVFRVNRGKKMGKPLYENALQDISFNGKCLLTLYYLNGKVYYIPGAGVNIEGNAREYLLENGDKLFCDGIEVSFVLGKESS